MRRSIILDPAAAHGAGHAEFGAKVIQRLRFHDGGAFQPSAQVVGQSQKLGGEAA